jgi:hypothetical protein
VIEASKTAEPSVPPRKRAWKAWALGLASVVAVITIALLASAPKPEPVKVWFVRATNEAGVKKLVFEGTNGTKNAVSFTAWLDPDVKPESSTGPNPTYREESTNRAMMGRNKFDFTLAAPTNHSPYTIVWYFYDEADFDTRWFRARYRCSEFFYTHNMRRLGWFFKSKIEEHYIPSTEIKE